MSANWQALPGIYDSVDPAFRGDFISQLSGMLPSNSIPDEQLSAAIERSSWYNKLGSGSNPYNAAREAVGNLGYVPPSDPATIQSWNDKAVARSPEGVARANDDGGFLKKALPLLGLAAAIYSGGSALGLFGETALGAGEAAGLGALNSFDTGAMAGALGGFGGEAAGVGGFIDALGGGGIGGAEAFGGGLGEGALSGAGFSEAASSLPDWLTANAPEVGGSLQDLAFPGSAAPYASYPAAEMSTALPGWVPTVDTAGPFTDFTPSPKDGSLWENVSTPFKTASNVLKEGSQSPLAKTLGNVKKLYDVYGALTQDPTAAPPQVSGLQQVAQQRRSGMSKAFGNQNFDAYR